VYLNTNGSPIEIGTDKLHSDPTFWRCMHRLITAELPKYLTPEKPRLDEDEEEFIFDGFAHQNSLKKCVQASSSYLVFQQICG
jgi:hypothetical protein